MTSVTKYPRTPHWVSSPGRSSDDKLVKDVSSFLNTELVITEKLDGGNTAIHDGKVFARSTGQEATAAWFKMVKKHHVWKSVGSNLVFYGEDLYAIHSIEYSPMKEENTYFVFNILDGDVFLSWDNVLEKSKEFGFNVVPVLYSGIFKTEKELSNWLEENIKTPSTLGGDKEGFVIRKKNSFLIDDFANSVCKYVRANHVQTNEHWTKNWRPVKTI